VINVAVLSSLALVLLFCGALYCAVCTASDSRGAQ